MVLSKRERVIRTLELDGEPDMVPIHFLGFEKTGKTYQHFKKTNEYKENETYIKNSFSNKKYKWAGSLTQHRFLNVDCHAMDPWFIYKYKIKLIKAPPEYPECVITPIDGKIWKQVKQVDTDLSYRWYIDGYFTTPEILHSYWDEYGKPSELINDEIDYTPKIWEEYVESLSPYLYPMPFFPLAMHEALFEGMTITRTAYYMRKKPEFIHEVMNEYTKVNLELIKRFAEAGVDVAMYFDDLGLKGRSIFSLEQFRIFILPYYKKLYQECKKRGIFIIQHSCGYIDKLLPDMVDSGLDCIQALEPAAGVDLAHLKETLGDRVAFMGGIDSSNILNFGTPKDVEEDVKKCIKAAAPGGGYFAGPSHNILNAPWENMLALRAALEKYRKYPLNF